MLTRSRPLALLLIVLTLVWTTDAWHAQDADTDFSTLSVHDHAAPHREALRAPAASKAPSHCALCHWLQSLRTGSVRHERVQPTGERDATRLAAIAPWFHSVDLALLPSRAPPA